MKRYFLMILFLSSFFTQSHSINKDLICFNISSLILNGALVLWANKIVKKGDKILKCNSIEKFEELKTLCAKDVARETYFKLMESKSNEEKLKGLTYYIGSNIKEKGEFFIKLASFFSSITVAVNILALMDELNKNR